MSTDVLTYPNSKYRSIKSDLHPLITEYDKNMSTYIAQMFPNVPEDKLVEMSRAIIKKKFKNPQCDFIHAETKSQFKKRSEPLLTFTNEASNYILTPYGSAFVHPSENTSIFRGIILNRQAERKIVKLEEITAEAAGDEELAMIKYLIQFSIKLGINIYSGVMLSNVSYRSAIHYNSITSAARFSTMVGYAYTERMVAANFYFPDENSAINWIANLLREYPGDATLQVTLDKYKIRNISSEELVNTYKATVNHYSKFSRLKQLIQLIHSLTPLQRAYVYYCQSLQRIVFTNDSMRNPIGDLIDVVNVDPYEGEITSIMDLKDESIMTLVTVLLADELLDADGKPITKNKIDTEYPALGKRIIDVYHMTEKRLSTFGTLFDTFVNLSVLPGDAIGHKVMSRKTVLLSDTDSIILTLMKWAEWYTGSKKLSPESFKITSAIIALLTKGFVHLFIMVALKMGVPEDDMRRIVMKNEYTYSAMLRSSIAKHYAGYINIREGHMLGKPKLDLKGRQFKGSTLGSRTLARIKEILVYILDSIVEGNQLTFGELVETMVRFEQEIILSSLKGSTDFLEIVSIKLAREYANPLSSNWLFADLWDIVFKDQYGEFEIPSKGRSVPIKKISAKQVKYIVDDKMRDGFTRFFKKYPGRKEIKRIIIPYGLEIPDIIKPIMDHDKMVRYNTAPLRLILKSFNIVTDTPLSNTYPGLAKQIIEEDSHD